MHDYFVSLGNFVLIYKDSRYGERLLWMWLCV